MGRLDGVALSARFQELSGYGSRIVSQYQGNRARGCAAAGRDAVRSQKTARVLQRLAASARQPNLDPRDRRRLRISPAWLARMGAQRNMAACPRRRTL